MKPYITIICLTIISIVELITNGTLTVTLLWILYGLYRLNASESA